MLIKIQAKTGYAVKDLNRRKAIRERCLNCSGWVVSEVTHCDFDGRYNDPNYDCPLWPYRLGTGKQDAVRRKKAISQYCLWCMNGRQAYEVQKCVSPDCPLFPYRMSGVDRSAEIKSLAEIHHIEPVLETKN